MEPQMNVLSTDKQLDVLFHLVEGCSIRSTSRLAGVHKTTILKLLVDISPRCLRMLDTHIHHVSCTAIECDEIWTFITKKERRLTEQDRLFHPDYGDMYTFVAFDPDTKLIPCFVVGKRDGTTAVQFIQELRNRVIGRIQISTDGFAPYVDAIEQAFGADVDYAQLIKVYEAGEAGMGRYSPPHVTEVVVKLIAGSPDSEYICTSYVERNNLTIRMEQRRFTRLTNAFSKKVENLKAALALHFWHYNFCRIHSSLRVTPAMEAGMTNRVWDLEEILYV
jgi:IS1 family transposase